MRLDAMRKYLRPRPGLHAEISEELLRQLAQTLIDPQHPDDPVGELLHRLEVGQPVLLDPRWGDWVQLTLPDRQKLGPLFPPSRVSTSVRRSIPWPEPPSDAVLADLFHDIERLVTGTRVRLWTLRATRLLTPRLPVDPKQIGEQGTVIQWEADTTRVQLDHANPAIEVHPFDLEPARVAPNITRGKAKP